MEKINFGVVGTNNITRWFLNGAMQDSRFNLSAICSRDIEKARQFADEFNAPLAFDSLAEMASDPHVDAVYIATPNVCHAEQAILCMRCGKHVLCEKPLASNAREVLEMIRVAHDSGVVLMEAMITTMTPNFRYIMDHIHDIGRIRRYFASYCQYSSRYDKFKEGIVLNAFKPELSNGAVMDIGIYTVYPLVVLFGKPTEISAAGLLLSTGVDGQGSATFRYPDMEANVIYSKIADSYLPSEIQGEEGTITMDNIPILKRVLFHSRKDKRVEDRSIPAEKDIYYYETKEFIDVILSGKTESSINSLANSLATIEVLDEIRRQVGVVFPADFRQLSSH
ncbi:MAG: Gfo/Idh/MocA family oxidoreductase [Bacteroidales bacterium]|nr:Gfo/Idh/MocA family oxidoreductase [Bacteroidales bacterium]